MPAYRTPVRYKGSREVCVRIANVPVRGDSAPILRVILTHGGEGRELLWSLPCERWIYPRRFVLLSAIPFCFSIFRLAIRLVLRPVLRPVLRLALRLALRAVIASRVIPLGVPFCVSFVRLVLRAVHASRCGVSSLRPVFTACRRMRYDFHTGRRFALLAACRLALRLVLGVCVSPCMPSVRVVPRFCPASRSALSLRSSRHAVSCSMPFLVSVLRFRSASCHCVPLFCLPVGCDFHEAPFRIARRSLYAVSNDPDETRREKRDEEARRGDGMKRRTRRGSRDEEQDERREARAEKVESSYAVSLGRLII